MPFPPFPQATEFSDETGRVFLDFQRRMGFPMTPNFMKVHGHSFAATSGIWGLLRGTLLSGNLPRSLKEMLIAAVSHDRKYLDLMELISLVGLAVYLNIVADATGVTPDDMFFQV